MHILQAGITVSGFAYDLHLLPTSIAHLIHLLHVQGDTWCLSLLELEPATFFAQAIKEGTKKIMTHCITHMHVTRPNDGLTRIRSMERLDLCTTALATSSLLSATAGLATLGSEWTVLQSHKPPVSKTLPTKQKLSPSN